MDLATTRWIVCTPSGQVAPQLHIPESFPGLIAIFHWQRQSHSAANLAILTVALIGDILMANRTEQLGIAFSRRVPRSICRPGTTPWTQQLATHAGSSKACSAGAKKGRALLPGSLGVSDGVTQHRPSAILLDSPLSGVGPKT
jgi:hypothetical protein